MPITGAITGGRHGRPFGRPLVDLEAVGYEESEWLLEGEATRYRAKAGAELGEDGVWDVEPAGSAPFRTRVVVYRPKDPQRFNGTAIVSWNNVTAGYDLFGGESPEILESGCAYVGVTVQKVGIEGLQPANQGLAAWDPERYGTLSHPGDDYSFDIYTQAAEAVRSGEILGGLQVRNVLAMGGSQSAGRLGTYVNAIHPLTSAFDGYLLTIYFGSGSQLEVGDTVVNINAPSPAGVSWQQALRGRNRLRSIDVPVFVVNSELEAIACRNVRQPDTDTFRYWEAAGTCHVSVQGLALRAPKYERDFGEPLPITPGINRIPMMPLYDAAIAHLRSWVDGGAAPPSQPLIDFDGDEVQRDEDGIATGGIRLPQVEVPIATDSAIPLAEDIFSILYGSSVPFPEHELDARYGDVDTYVAQFEEAARRAEKAGVLLPRDVDSLVDEARRTYPTS
jgi:hypothetical protein